MLQHFRTNEYWNQVYKYVTDIAKLHSIPKGVNDDLRPSRKRRRPAHLEDIVITEFVGSRELTTTKDHFKTNLYLPVVDQFIMEMNECFNHSSNLVLKGISACSPSSSVFLDFSEMKPFCLMYGIDVDTLEIELALLSRSMASVGGNITNIAELGCYLHSCQPVYKNLYHTVRLTLTIAVTSAECERSFSTLKRIKTRLRTTMGEDRLSDSAILSIERDLASSIKYEEIINDFATSDNNRRITLS